ncbi:hypothetical protein GIB67_016006 [Kingdonia uniflora]|uniref:Agenet domain-containing protein n=1 Tax=Kingdonia uniflora TaxID=39325 RepID=A0A7J7L1N7_9MAGN|nr:hypothetical protein GIB67_016006 [Kingdonia uniflora]
MKFQEGDRVEVQSKEDGFLGSYYEATVVTAVGKHKYLVKYKTLLTEDETESLQEIVDASEVRPTPPEIKSFGAFGLLDVVDAFDNDGWWVGKTTGKGLYKYVVYFDKWKIKIGYPPSELRVHQDWVDGKWVRARKEWSTGRVVGVLDGLW